MKAIIPERFGCASKISLSEIKSIRSNTVPFSHHKIYDASIREFCGMQVASSIDKVYDLGLPPQDFALAAFTHCARDLLAAGAKPVSCDIAFEFGLDASEAERKDLSVAFAQFLTTNDIIIGKIHSGFANTTSATLSLIGPIIATFRDLPSKGTVLLSEPIGKLHQLYFSAIRNNRDYLKVVDSINKPYFSIIDKLSKLISGWTDVSGYGLIGSLIMISDQFEVDIEFDNNSVNSLFSSMDVIPPCLISDADGLEIPPLITENQKKVLSLREICGPMLCLCDNDNVHEIKELLYSIECKPIIIGNYTKRI